MKKILYVMHVPWGWIKQRPHFIAEYLSKDFDVKVIYREANTVRSKNLTTNAISNKLNLKITSYRSFPFQRIPIFKYFDFSFVNKLLFRIKSGDLNQYDYIWVTSPLQAYLVDSDLSNRIIYDCMDDFLEFEDAIKNHILKKEIQQSETLLLQNAKYVFCSSLYLSNKILSRSNVKRDIFIINNAININIENSNFNTFEINTTLDKLKTLSNVIMYVGTISEWIDFNFLLSFLNLHKNANFVMIGPTGNKQFPKHDRIHYMGAIDNRYVFQIMTFADVLIMPFIVNELIKSVNPVKLYEYIYTGKAVVAPKYGETIPFERFIYTYTNFDEFSEILIKCLILKQGKESPNLMKEFAQRNTWEDRYSIIKNTIEK